jgi:hypothetical protein
MALHEDVEGHVVLSKEKADRIRAWKEIEKTLKWRKGSTD